MERIRLTKRMAGRNRKADSAEPATPIDLGKNRTYHKIDEYHTYKPTLNHWEPDMRHDWEKDQTERLETNHGTIRMAKVYMAAKKATKLAMMLLGDNASEASIENQARAFMRMGDKALTASIERWAQCKGEECDKAPAVPTEACKGEGCDEAPKTTEACKFAGDKDESKAPETKAPESQAPETTEAAKKGEKKEEAPKAPEAPEAPADAPAEAPADAKADGDIDVPGPQKFDDVSFDDDGEGADDAGADEELKGLFEDTDDGEGTAPEAEEAPAAPKKAGIKHLAGQPTLTRVASAKNADDLTGLWDKWDNLDVR